jgi:hypothetical protein
MNTSLCRADKHVLMVVHKRQWRRWGRKMSYLRCFCCELEVGPLPWRGRASLFL